MFKLTRQGVVFAYHGDTVLRRWPWAPGSRYFSRLPHVRDFSSFKEYWRRVGVFEAQVLADSPSRVIGFRKHEVLAEFTRTLYPCEYVVVLDDIDAAKKDAKFWSRVPKYQAEQLTKDTAVFRCKGRKQAVELSMGIDLDFAASYVFYNGQLLDSNHWGE